MCQGFSLQHSLFNLHANFQVREITMRSSAHEKQLTSWLNGSIMEREARQDLREKLIGSREDFLAQREAGLEKLKDQLAELLMAVEKNVIHEK